MREGARRKRLFANRDVRRRFLWRDAPREAERDGGAIPALLSRMRTNQESAYAVVTALGAIEKTERSGLSHVAAMRLAEELRRDGKVAIVMHVVGGKSYEVDRYPAR